MFKRKMNPALRADAPRSQATSGPAVPATDVQAPIPEVPTGEAGDETAVGAIDEETQDAEEDGSPDGGDLMGLGLKPLGVHALIVRTVFERALGPELVKRLGIPHEGICICLSVPDASWENPLRELARHYGRPVQVMFRDVSRRMGTVDVDTVSSFAKWLHQGSALVCASQDARLGLPPQIRSVADVVVHLHAPTPDEIVTVMARLAGRPVDVRPPADLGQGLTLDEVVACLRTDGDAVATFARLLRAQAARSTSAVDTDGPRLEDLAGYGQAAEWAARLRQDLDAYRAGRLAWRRLDARAILYGPPGTGKSLFAPALARSLGVPCSRTSVGQWFVSHSGDLGQTVRAATAAFAEARAAALAHGAVVLFVDEVDGLPNRGAIGPREASWWRPVVNHVLATLDGDGSDLDGVIVVGATNDISAVDPALLRPGRLGTHLAVFPPDLADLASILLHHLGGASCPIPASQVTGMLRARVGATPAQAAAWASQALRRARDAGRTVALDDVAAVLLPTDTRQERDRRRVATHEAGHAVVAWLLARGRLVSTSILKTADWHGATALASRDESLLLRDEMEEDVVLLLAGRAADTVVGDGPSAAAGGVGPGAASSDLGLATVKLTAVHACYGLGGTLRHRGDLVNPTGLHHDWQVPRLVEADLRRLMTQAERLVRGHASAVRAVADALLERQTLDAAEVGRIVAAAKARGAAH